MLCPSMSMIRPKKKAPLNKQQGQEKIISMKPTRQTLELSLQYTLQRLLNASSILFGVNHD